MLHANPASHKVNIVEEKLSPTLNCKPHLSKRWKKTLRTLSSNNILPQFFLSPNMSSALINLLSHFFNWINVVFHPIFLPLNTKDTLFKKILGSLNPTVYFYKYVKNMRYLYQAYIVYNTYFIIHTHLYYFEENSKFFLFVNINYPIFSRTLFSNIIAVNSNLPEGLGWKMGRFGRNAGLVLGKGGIGLGKC